MLHNENNVLRNCWTDSRLWGLSSPAKKEYWRNYKTRNQTSLISDGIPKPETQTKSKMVGVLFSNSNFAPIPIVWIRI